jgi:glycogen(starch) synthase
MHEFQNLHAQYKQKIHDFVRGHFYGHYDFDLDNTVVLRLLLLRLPRASSTFLRLVATSTATRASTCLSNHLPVQITFHRQINFIVLGLNEKLKYLNSPVTVVAFIIMPAATHSFSVDALKGQAVMKQLKETVSDIQQSIGRRIFEECARFVTIVSIHSLAGRCQRQTIC